MNRQHELCAARERVNDGASVLAFVRLLIKDRVYEVEKKSVSPSSPYGPGVNGWENGTIESYLDAALRWAEDSALGKEPEAAQNPWNQRSGRYGTHTA